MFYLFATYDNIWYMPIPPLGDGPLILAVDYGFEVMDRLNLNRSCSRIENLTFDEMSRVDLKRYNYALKSWDYLYDRVKLTGLKGDRYKGKRVSYNYFTAHHQPKFLSFSPEDIDACLSLYERWFEMKKNRLAALKDPYELCLLEDNRKACFRMIKEFQVLGLIGRVVRLGSEVRGFIIGAKLTDSTLVVVAEIADLSLKGLAQYLFREFCQEMTAYQWINVMDDSGLASLRRVKESYHPDILVPAYILSHPL